MRRAGIGSAVVAVALGLAAGAYVLHVRHVGRDVQGSSTVEFTPQPPAPAKAVRATQDWPMYGLGPARLRAVDGVGLRPPYRRLWTWHGGALLEFPPVVAGGRLFLATFDGRMYGIDAHTGRAVWRYDTHRCGWASPAIAGTLVIETFIGHSCAADTPGSDGEVIAFSRRTGAIAWRRTIGPVESSPLVDRGVVFVADWTGHVLALAARTGVTRWSFRTGGAIKSSPSLAAGRIYVGGYDGHVYALAARTGRLVWRASAQPRLGSRGRFYSTAAVAYDRVYIGATDGKVYSFGAESGRLRWSRTTGGYVYAAPAVWHGLVLAGSYGGSFFAFDAATGVTRWSFRANGPISGAASVVDGVVYFSTFAHTTYALDAETGRRLWTWPDGEYSPIVTDGLRLYLTGRGKLYALVPIP
ncbi:MAG TPA: PQQ-binding-like beta-propeller repeat protein [Gaiellaceae bacterium]